MATDAPPADLSTLEWLNALSRVQINGEPMNDTWWRILSAVAIRRLDWGTGTGYASERSVAGDAGGKGERTVRRVLSWAVDAGWLQQTKRGHRIDAERVRASEWRLTQPATALAGWPETQPAREEDPTGHSSGRPSLPMTQPVPTGLRSSVGDKQSRRNAHANGGPDPAATEDEAWDRLIGVTIAAVEDRTGRRVGPEWAGRVANHILDAAPQPPDNDAAYVRQAIRDEPKPEWRFLSHHGEDAD